MALSDELLEALKAHEQEKPRSKQLVLGPSEVGGCREYIRNVMMGTPRQPGDEWPTAAVMGTLVGEHVEKVAEKYLGAVTEVPVVTELPNGLTVAGHSDIVIADRNIVADVKSKDKFDGVKYEGPSLENCVQISIYALGLVQAGVLTEGCTAHLLYVDRSGEAQVIHEVVIDWEEMQQYIDVAVSRLQDVIDAQDRIDEGDVEAARELRDKTPPFCYSKKVQCPFRDACWKGSDWVPHDVIEDPDILKIIDVYKNARDTEKVGGSMRREYREKLRGVSGVTPDGWSVTWAGSEDRPMLYVTKVR